MKYTLTGPPIPLARARHGQGRTWDTQKAIKWAIGQKLKHQHKALPLAGPLSLTLCFFMPIPKSLSKVKKDALKGKPHYLRPDIDNLIKFILDSANGILYLDDAQIYTINAHKIYDEHPRTEIEIFT